MIEHRDVLCKHCECTLDRDYEEVGICGHCLDLHDDEETDNRAFYYGTDWDVVAEDQY